MIRYIPELVKSGISSFKIEGRVKTSYYTATIIKAYREEIDRYFADPENYKFDESQFEELCKVSHRPYSTGFYLGKPTANEQVYTDSSYIRDFGGMIKYKLDGYMSRSEIMTILTLIYVL